MKKSFLYLCLVILLLFGFSASALCEELSFSDALKTCKKYYKQQELPRFGTSFTLTISLENKSGNCVYKEKISQGEDYNLLTCNFPKTSLDFISKTMEDYNAQYKTEIAKEKIFEAKMSSSNVMMDKYLGDPKYCKITGARAKQKSK